MKLACMLVLLMVSSVHGELYTWTDGRGTAHYTNSLYEVPARYRSRVKVLNLGTEPKSDGSASVQQPPQPAPAATVEPQKPRPALTRERPQRRRGEADE